MLYYNIFRYPASTVDAGRYWHCDTVSFKSYHLLDVYMAWVGDNYRVTARVDNLADEDYVSWADVFYLGQTDPSFIYANQVMMGAPRNNSVTMQWQF